MEVGQGPNRGCSAQEKNNNSYGHFSILSYPAALLNYDPVCSSRGKNSFLNII
jgi:hypothetical protein